MAMKLSAKDHIHNFELEHASSKQKKKMKRVLIKARPETSHIVSSGSDQLLHRDMSSLFEEGSNKELFDRDIDYAKIPGINKITASQMKSLKEKTKKNAKKIESVLNLAKAVDSLGSGIGSGGYISRKLKAPGPHNGHNYVAPHERLIQADLKLPENIDDYLPKPKELVHDHPWDKNFVVAKSISRDAYDEIKKITTFSALQIEVKEMCSKTGLISSTPKAAETMSPTRKSHESSGDVESATRSEEGTEYDDDDEFDDEGGAEGDYKNQRQGLVAKLSAEVQWAKNLQRVHFIGSTVLHIDLWEISQYFEPPEIIVDVVGYFCILLGLKPTWDSAQGYLFKEINQVLKFLVHSEPFKIPKRRLRKAKQLKEEKFAERMLMLLIDNKAMKKLVNWIFQFQKLADVILKVDERTKGKRALPSPQPAPAPNEKDDKKKKSSSPSKDKPAQKESAKDLGEFFIEYQAMLDNPEPEPVSVSAPATVAPEVAQPPLGELDASQFEAEYFKDEPPEPFEFVEAAPVAAQATAATEEAVTVSATTAPPPNVPEPQGTPKKLAFMLSDKIEANYGGKGNWYKGTITKVHASGSYDIKYDDGDNEIAVERTNVRELLADGAADAAIPSKWAVGDKVEGNYGGKGNWFKGRVARVFDSGLYRIEYDDGDFETDVAESNIRTDVANGAVVLLDKEPKTATVSSPQDVTRADDDYAADEFDAAVEPPAKKPATPAVKKATFSPSIVVPSERVVKFKVGDKVEGNYKGKGKWRSGKVTKVSNNGSYDVTYEDKHVDYMLKKPDVRKISSSEGGAAETPTSSSRGSVDVEPSLESTKGGITSSAPVSDRRSASPSKGLRVGDNVEALGFKSKGKWLKGVIAKVNSNGSYDVNFDDGSLERMVKKANVRPNEGAAGKAAESKAGAHIVVSDENIAVKKVESASVICEPLIESKETTVTTDHNKPNDLEIHSEPPKQEMDDLNAGVDNYTNDFEEEEEDTKKSLEENEEAAKQALEEEAAKQKALEEEAAKQALEEEAAKQALEEEAAKQALEEEAAKQALEEAAKQALEEEAAKQKALEEEAAKQKALEEEAAKQALEEEAARQALAEEASRQKAVEAESARRQAADDEAEVIPKPPTTAEDDYADDEFDVLDD